MQPAVLPLSEIPDSPAWKALAILLDGLRSETSVGAYVRRWIVHSGERLGPDIEDRDIDFEAPSGSLPIVRILASMTDDRPFSDARDEATAVVDFEFRIPTTAIRAALNLWWLVHTEARGIQRTQEFCVAAGSSLPMRFAGPTDFSPDYEAKTATFRGTIAFSIKG